MKNFSVQHTTNLGQFKFHDVNRDLSKTASKTRIKRIAESMMQDGLMKVPIIVTSKFIVVDGQHRLEAAKIAGKGIWFIVDTSIVNTSKGVFDAARKFNCNMKEWSKEDYIHGFVNQGNKSYEILDKFGKKFPMFSLTERIMMLSEKPGNYVEKNDFASGKFVVHNLDRANQLAEGFLKLRPYFDGYNKSVFVRTLLSLMEKKPEFIFDEFVHKVSVRPDLIKVCGDKKSCGLMVEEIYNYKRPASKKLNLRF